MIVKILDFNNNQLITDPLNSEALVYSVSLLNINSESIKFLPITDVNNVSSITIEYDEEFTINDLNIVADVSKGARYILDVIGQSLVVISESGLISKSYVLIFEAKPSLSTILISKIEESGQLVDSYKRLDNLNIAYLDYIDNDVKYFNISANTNFNSTTVVETISFDGIDPDGQDLHGSSLDPFTDDEELILNSNFLYLRISRLGIETQYVELHKSLNPNDSSYFNYLKKELSNKWLFSYFDRILVEPSYGLYLDHNLSTKSSVQEVKIYLYGLGVKYWDVRNYLDILLDFSPTDQFYNDLYSKFSLQNSIEYNDLGTFGIEQAGKDFARLIRQELIDFNIAIDEKVLQYLQTIYDPIYKESLCSEKYQNIKKVYLSNTGISTLSHLSVRLLKHIQSYLTNAQYRQSSNLLFYNVTNVDFERFLQVINTMIYIRENFQYTQLSVENGVLFFKLLENITKNESIGKFTL